MSRRRKSGPGGFLYFLGSIFAYFIPAVFVGLWIYFELRYLGLIAQARQAGFDGTGGLRAWSEILDQGLSTAQGEAEQLYQVGHAHEIPQRADGRFDARSKMGKSLNYKLSIVEADCTSASEALSEIASTTSARFASRASVLAWGGATGYFLIFGGKEFLSASAYGSIAAAAVGLIAYSLT